MGKIRVLPPEVVERIAAGEVIERPASVVKELVENSLDAGATRVEVTLQRAGLDLIAVRDDGEGMTPEDARLALVRHATSKISKAEDLIAVQSFGFRGEALPSIAAVAHLKLVSAVPGAVEGVQVECAGGSEPEVTPCAAAPGTLVEVRRLFFNTPARFKFLKSEHTELKHIVEVLTRLAVLRPDVSFRATSDGRDLFTTSGSGSRRAVLELVLGRGEDIGWIPFEAENRHFRLAGWLAPPEFARATRSQQVLIVNGRWVKSSFLALAVEAGYGPHLVNSRHPVFCLEVNTAPGLVDVNVHPAKLEVRLSHEKELRALIQDAVRRALGQKDVLLKAPARMPLPASGDNSGGTGTFVKEESAAYREEGLFSFACPHAPASVGHSARPLAAGTAEPLPEGPPNTEGALWPGFVSAEYLGQALGTYLVTAGPDGIYLVDQHAAHERVLFEKLGQNLDREGIPVQPLVVPQTIVVTEPEHAAWASRKEYWNRIGLQLEEFGTNTLILRAVPQILPVSQALNFVRDLLEETQEIEGEAVWEKERRHFLSLLACHAAIRAGQVLSPQEATHLLAELGRCRHPFNCPHGRPTVICLSRRELEKRFLRLLG
ncbi:MAG: mismatch repair protein MutL [Bacillota bacterium]|nr:mismatch repair protein MutL [Bacillota bacterium]MDK2925413.1 mismatch repair protein MutL [Bacillota bacterium]MDK2959977.1 mismatch repair protein MutL [Bacillota bacterium]